MKLSIIMKKHILVLFYLLLAPCTVQLMLAGNPDRQGEAGAYELLMFPWARTAGLSGMNTSFISGAESMRLNAAGLAHVKTTQAILGHTRYFDGTGINMNGLALGQRISENGVFGVSIVALDFGDIPITTTAQPEGSGASFSPSWFNIGISYGHSFENKVSVGFLVRGIFESTAEVAASGFAFDAGVQYFSGDLDEFKFGISLRNVGSRMKFGGSALDQQLQEQTNSNPIRPVTFSVRTADFEIPSVLNIGISYDFLIGSDQRLTVLGNFTANSFSRDQIGGGVEYSFDEKFMLRAGYKHEYDTEAAEDLAGREIEGSIYTGLSIGASFEVPLNKEKPNNTFGIDYAYRETALFNGTHNLGIRIGL